MFHYHQLNIENYHDAISGMHPGYDMHRMHRDWHNDNKPPLPPSHPNPDWGVSSSFGSKFLQMHHSMLHQSAASADAHGGHIGLVDWYKQESLLLPPPWVPGIHIPSELTYTPDASTYPTDIQEWITEVATRKGKTPEQWLARTTDYPRIQIPRYFTERGVTLQSDADPLTGAQRLSDFENVNQLGCSLVYPHNEWHIAIGGAMSSTVTALADPIFYFGVHWVVDNIYTDFLRLKTFAANDYPAGWRQQRGELTLSESQRHQVTRFVSATRQLGSNAGAEALETEIGE